MRGGDATVHNHKKISKLILTQKHHKDLMISKNIQKTSQ